MTAGKRNYMKEWRQQNRDDLRVYARDWLRKNKEANAPKAAVRNARYYQKKKQERQILAQGANRYNAGLPCKNGNIAERLTSSGGCCCDACRAERRARYQLKGKKPGQQARLQAKQEGRKRYQSARPCKNGHIAERLVSNGSCLCSACEKERREKNREAKIRYTKSWRERNPEKVLAYKRLYAATKPELVSAWNARFREQHRDQRAEQQNNYRRAHPDLVAATLSNWRAARPGVSRAYSARYRAALLRATPKWADSERIVAFYKQAYLLSRETGVLHHVDHIVPLRGKRVCGLHTEENLRVITWVENLKKGNRHEL